MKSFLEYSNELNENLDEGFFPSGTNNKTKIDKNKAFKDARFGFSYKIKEDSDGSFMIVDQDDTVVHKGLGKSVADDVLKRLQAK